MTAPKFKPHHNRELGKTYYSAKDYYSDVKKAGLEPYDSNSVKHKSPEPYKRSEWAREMHQDIKDRNGRKPGDRFINELSKRGFTKEKMELARRMADERI